MKLLIKLVIIGFAAKAFVATPKGASKQIDRVGDMTVRQVAHEVDAACNAVQKKVTRLLE